MDTPVGHRIVVCDIGELNQAPPDDVHLVAHDADYVCACREIVSAVQSASTCKVWVRSKYHFAWLRDFTAQIGCDAVFQAQTPRLVLADLWNVRLPDWLIDTDVVEQGLLEIAPAGFRAKQADFHTRLLGFLLGSAFHADALDNKTLVEVIGSLVSASGNEALERYPILRRCLEVKCAQWSDAAEELWVREVSSGLAEDAHGLWQWLSAWVCLNAYPLRLLEYVLTPDQIRLVRKVPPEVVSALPLEPEVIEQVVAQIDFLFNEVKCQVKTSEDFQKAAEWVCGRLFQEFQHLSQILKSGSFSPTEADIRKVQEKFRSCPTVSDHSLNALRYWAAPERPLLPEPGVSWTAEQWIRWTSEEYTHYRAWQVHNGHYEEALEQAVSSFSDWYVAEYPAIQKDARLSLIHCLESLAASGSKDELSIVLLVDCLPLVYFGLLDEALRNVAFKRHRMEYRFAALPTATAFNKPALVSGNWEDVGSNYEALLKARSQTHWNRKKIVYLSNLKGLVELTLPQEPAVILLNFVDGDELLHSDMESRGTTHSEELQRMFVRMAEAVSGLSAQWSGPKERIAVHVVTDHGACRILEEERRSFDSMVINNLFAEEKHRFAVVHDSQTSDVPDNLWNLGYRFKPPFTESGDTYFLPKGHHTVRSHGKKRGYSHGGVTPEEVIVATALYRLVQVEWREPAARFVELNFAPETGKARFYIQRIVTLSFELQNPNTVEIELIDVRVIAPDTDVKSFKAVKFPANTAGRFQIGCYFQKSALAENRLEIEFIYEISGERRTFSLSLDSEFKSAMSGGFKLRDL